MGKLISIIGPSGIGKTTLLNALSSDPHFITALEQHAERPFQQLFKNDSRYALANQLDYFLLRAEQEKELRVAPEIGLIDGGLDLDMHGFTRLFFHRNLISAAEFDLCLRLYNLIRHALPPPDLFISLQADSETVISRLSGRQRINIANAADTDLFNAFVNEWLQTISSERVLTIDVTHESRQYTHTVQIIRNHIHDHLK